MQAKKRQYDQEVENLEKKQKQTIERLEQDHTSRLRDEAKRIKADQDKELSKFQNMLKNRKKEVWSCMTLSASECADLLEIFKAQGRKLLHVIDVKVHALNNIARRILGYVRLFLWEWCALPGTVCMQMIALRRLCSLSSSLFLLHVAFVFIIHQSPGLLVVS